MKKNNWKNKPVMICGKQYEINAIGTLVWTGETWVEVKEDSENDRYIEIGGDVLYFDPEPQDTTLAPEELFNEKEIVDLLEGLHPYLHDYQADNITDTSVGLHEDKEFTALYEKVVNIISKAKTKAL